MQPLRVIHNCRICGAPFFDELLLHYTNMPAIAQNFPSIDSLSCETGVDLAVCQCSGCGLVQLNSEPVPYFKEVIRSSAFSEEMRQFRLSQFSDFVSRFSLLDKKIVEIGCGKGEYLSLMSLCGVDAYGVEHSEESLSECINLGLKATQGFVDSKSDVIPGSPFDAFFILSFLEHLPDINSVLRGVCNNLSNDAIGLVEVPNFNMIIKNRLFSEFTRDHLYYFTEDTLLNTLQINGFDVLEISKVWHHYILSAVVRRKKRHDFSFFYDVQVELQKNINEYIDKFAPGKVAIWGAGHQALSVMSLSGLSGKIRYVVDSATFKQGHFTPATHIPIVSPDKLISDPVDAIIVMAASYSDEVISIIRKNFKHRISLSVFKDNKIMEII